MVRYFLCAVFISAVFLSPELRAAESSPWTKIGEGPLGTYEFLTESLIRKSPTRVYLTMRTTRNTVLTVEGKQYKSFIQDLEIDCLRDTVTVLTQSGFNDNGQQIFRSEDPVMMKNPIRPGQVISELVNLFCQKADKNLT